MTITQEQIAEVVERLRHGDEFERVMSAEKAADMLEQLATERNTCPFGDDCDLTVAWMAGRSKGFEDAMRERAGETGT